MANQASMLAWDIPWRKEPGSIVHGVAKESDKS